MYGECGEQDEGSQQGEAEVETACSQARTSHPQNLYLDFSWDLYIMAQDLLCDICNHLLKIVHAGFFLHGGAISQ